MGDGVVRAWNSGNPRSARVKISENELEASVHRSRSKPTLV